MADSSIYTETRDYIKDRIYKNGNGEITGPVLQDVLLKMLDYTAYNESEIRKYHPEGSGQEFRITTYVYPQNAGNVTGDGSYMDGSFATLVANAYDGYEFDKWSDTYDGNYTRVVEVTGNASYTACFIEKSGPVPPTPVTKYTVTLSSVPTVGGSLTGGGKYNDGSIATIEARANHGYVFREWNDGTTTSSTNPLSFTVMEDVEYQAYFDELTKYTVSATSDPSIGGTVSGTGQYYEGDEVTLVASPKSGYTFNYWNDNPEDTSTRKKFFVTESVSHVAHFVEVPQTSTTILYAKTNSERIFTDPTTKFQNLTGVDSSIIEEGVTTFTTENIETSKFLIAIPESMSIVSVSGLSNGIISDFTNSVEDKGTFTYEDEEYNIYGIGKASAMNLVFTFTFND